jgi:predicted dehydrogenase
MKILLIGLGSIGKRHLNNILHLGFEDVTIVSRSGNIPSQFGSLNIFAKVEDALETAQFDAAIVCTPTALHIHALKLLLKKNIKNIYVEKPISNDFSGVVKIQELIKSNNCRVQIGFDMHYDLGLQKVKQLIQQKTIGKIVSANAQVGQYLPDWRPHEDYSKGMSAKKETGGGVMLDLVHEFDYLHWLLGDVKTIASFNKNSGSLKIETEDIAEVLMKFNKGALATIHLDYLQQKLVRNCLITGSIGSIKWDLVNSKVNWILNDKSVQEFDYTGFERNDRFVNIMKDFLESSNNDRVTLFENGLASLQMVLAAKYSSEQNVFVQLDEFHPA